MSEFLVHVRVRWPADGDPKEHERLTQAETARRAELIAAGCLRRMWRDPGQWANWTLWNVTDATELHEFLQSLPLFPWMTLTIHPLVRHKADPEQASTDDPSPA